MRERMSILCAIACALASVYAHAWTDPVDSPAEVMPLVANSLKLAIAKSGDRYIAVGGRGEIVYSNDATTWKQAQVPTRSTFTAITAIDANVWAVGHEGIIAHSSDRGEHWTLQRQKTHSRSAAKSTKPRAIRTGRHCRRSLHRRAARHGRRRIQPRLRTDDGGEHWNVMSVASLSTNPAAKNDDDFDDDTTPAKNDGR